MDANTVYGYSIDIEIEEEEYINDVSAEIDELREEHQFFYISSESLDLDHAYGDSDTNGHPVGLLGTFTTGESSLGNLTVILRCHLKKNATGVSDGEIINAGGNTSIEIIFPITIQ
ncbi:MAG: hypothetical protein AAF551_04185 [Bacteroidota bacterium]